MIVGRGQRPVSMNTTGVSLEEMAGRQAGDDLRAEDIQVCIHEHRNYTRTQAKFALKHICM